jgi:hypothetical protein
LFFARIGSEVVGAQGVASKRFFAIFGHFRATKKGRFLGFGFLVVDSPLRMDGCVREEKGRMGEM